MEKLDKSAGQSMDVVADNIAKLKELFPETITENKIDFDTLKALLGEEIELEDERYSFNWHGKAQARRLAQSPSTGTLRPYPQESSNWDVTQNIFIEGDNLEVLKLLQKSYHNQVKMIYIDPPYNTGSDFVYPDNFKDNIQNYLEITGQVASGRKVATNTETSGRYHTDWLNMMFPRLKLAKNLLSNEGVIFISIDDNEVTNLKLICNEIFGEENFIACLPTVMNLKGNNDQFGFSGTHEYCLVYGKNLASIEELGGIALTENDISEYSETDLKGRYKKGATLMRTGEAGAREKRPKGYYPIYVSKDLKNLSIRRSSSDDFEIFPKTQDGKEMSWRRSPETLNNSIDEFVITKTSNGIAINKKQRLNEDLVRGKKPKSLFYKPEYSSGNGTEQLKALFNKRIFNNPKPLELIKDFISVGSRGEGLILDFFAGSGTTAHAIFEFNLEKLKSLKFITVQLPETLENSEFKNIAEITKQRIRLAGEKVKTDNPNYKGDLGFKVFKLDSSNFKVWDADFDSMAQDLAEATEVVKPDRKPEDILFEILLKYGLDLTLPINTHTVAGKTVYEVGAGALIVCLDDGVTEAVAEGIGELKEKLEPEVMRVIFKDSSFASDAAKVNIVQVLKQYGINDVKSI